MTTISHQRGMTNHHTNIELNKINEGVSLFDDKSLSIKRIFGNVRIMGFKLF